MFSQFVISIVVIPAVMLMASTAYAGVDDMPPIPESLANLYWVGEEIVLGRVERDGEVYPWVAEDNQPAYTLPLLQGEITMSAGGEIRFTFQDETYLDEDGEALTLKGGTLYYGFVQADSQHPLPVYYKKPAVIEEDGTEEDGTAIIPVVSNLRLTYDMVKWRTQARAALGYRVVDATGRILYDGRTAFVGDGSPGKPFRIDTCIVQGPLLAKLEPEGMVIAFETNRRTTGLVTVDGRTFRSSRPGTRHEVPVTGLSPDTWYTYTVTTEDGLHAETRRFRTAPAAGTRKPFVFAYASDSRSGQGGGERSVLGVNAYIVKRMMALARSRDAAFFQFTGDMIDGYRTNSDAQRVEYANWVRAIEPWAGNMPVIVGMGNHEGLGHIFTDGAESVQRDRFPYADESSERILADFFVNPENGPLNEDGPYPGKAGSNDFPSYKENVFWYRYDNVAMIVLNSNYWYSWSLAAEIHRFKGLMKNPTLSEDIKRRIANRVSISGNLHGYIMDNQLEWLRITLRWLESRDDIDYIFVTHHTPVFPNGGHVKDDMWYHGSNLPRPWVNGKPLAKGIIERRDEYWKTLMGSPKVVAVLTGDEHNYSKLLVRQGTDIYGHYDAERDAEENSKLFRFMDGVTYQTARKIALTRPVWQIHNGAAGAPYYAQDESVPWNRNNEVQSFTTQNALILFYVNEKDDRGQLIIRVKVENPDTLAVLDEFTIHPE